MTRPCLCGDPACPHCGSPGQTEAEEALCDRLAAEKLTPAEYQIVAEVGLVAVREARKVADEVAAEAALGVERAIIEKG